MVVTDEGKGMVTDRKRGRRGKGGDKRNVSVFPIRVIALINIRGGKGRHKWEELGKVAKERYLDVLVITETHFKDVEVPPYVEGYSWYGVSRKADQSRFGGVGVWVKCSLEVKERHELEGKYVVIEIGGSETILVVGVYRPPSSTAEEDTLLYNVLRRAQEELFKGAVNRVIYLGDFNAHIGELDVQTDKAGVDLKRFVAECQLCILNLDERMKGKYTYTEGSKKSCIDYVI